MKYENVRLNEENEEREKERERARIALEVTADYEKRREERRSIENSWVLNMNFLCGNQYCDVSPIGGLTEEDPQFYWQSRRVFNHIAPTIESRIANTSTSPSTVLFAVLSHLYKALAVFL